MLALDSFDEVAPGIWSALPAGERTAHYDNIARGYDLVVGNALYNRVVWGCPKQTYNEMAHAFLMASTTGPIIDFGCGSLVFTATGYRGVEDRLILFDRSLGMLRQGKKRLPSGQFLQGDAFAPPFGNGSFAGGMGWGMLHVFGTASDYLANLHRILSPGGTVAIGTLVLSGRTIGDRMLNLLHAKGEAALPESRNDVETAFSRLFDIDHSKLAGNMLFLQGRKGKH